MDAVLSSPSRTLGIIPHVDGSPRICELVEYYMEDIQVKGAWTGPAALSLTPHVLARPTRDIDCIVHLTDSLL